MSKNYFFLFLLAGMLVSGCGPKGSDDKSHLFLAPVDAVKIDTVRSLKVECFLLETVEASFTGYVDMYADTIYYIDSRFCWVFRYDKEGKLIDRKLGMGRGPGEIISGVIHGYARLSDGSWFFVGSTNDGYIFNRHFIQKKSFFFDKGKSNELSYENPQSYTLQYYNLKMKEYAGTLYYNVYAQKKGLDYFSNRVLYYNDMRLFSQMDLATGKVNKMIGRYSPFHDGNKNLKLFCDSYFDIDQQGNFYVTFDADSMVYSYDKDYKARYSTGFQGKKMNTRYPVISTVNDYKQHYYDRDKYGHYSQICYIDETGLMFRSYFRAEYQPYDGLQIYKGAAMIGDVDVPKGFKIIGYTSPYYYGYCGIDEENENITICRFKL